MRSDSPDGPATPRPCPTKPKGLQPTRYGADPCELRTLLTGMLTMGCPTGIRFGNVAVDLGLDDTDYLIML